MAMTQQEVIKRFMYSLRTTEKTGTTAVDEAVRYATDNKFTGLSNLKDRFLNDIQRVNDGNTFLKDYAGIILDNDDTGAITGADADNGTVKTASSVVFEKDDVSNWDYVAPGSSVTLSSGMKVNLPSSITVYEYVYYTFEDSSKNYWGRKVKETRSLNENAMFILKCVPHWLEACDNLAKESFGFTFDGTACKTYNVEFGYDDDKTRGGWLAETPTTIDNSTGKATAVGLRINLHYYSNLNQTNADGLDTKSKEEVLDRTIVHEMVHALMAANDKYASCMSAYITEGMAELVHGVDDTRSAIISLASDANLMEQAIAETKHWADYPTVTSGNVKLNAPCYAGGYTLLRYMGKQAADSYVKLFTGTNAADNFETRNDFVTISSAGGNDSIISHGNNSLLDGGAGADSIIIGGESTTVEGGQDNDEISLTSASKNTLMLYRVGDGNDTIYNSKSTDTLSIDGGAAYAETAINGTTFLGVGDASIALTGERPKIVQSNVEGAAITLNNSFSNTLITGSDDADSIVNTGFSVTINGGAGNDTLKNGSYENGAVFNGGNSVSIFAGDGDNYIYGKEDKFVTIVAGNGNDSAHSYKGENNSIDLAGGNNYFNGYYAKGISVSCGAQDDTLCAWGGENLSYSAGDGNNYVLLKDVTNSTFACGVGNDSVYISGSANSVDVGTGNNFVSLGSSSKNDTVMCAAGNSTIKNIDGSQNVYYCDFDGNAANISLVGANSGDTIFIAGYTAFETLNNGTELVVKSGNGILRAINAVDKNITVRNCGDPPAPDTLTSEEPPSSKTLITLTNSDKSKVTLKSPIKDADASSRTKSIKIAGNKLDNSIVGGAGNDSFVGSSGNDTMIGGVGKDTLKGGKGDDNLEGGKDKDRLYGEDGRDFLSGGGSADYLSGGAGNDTLDGGTNNDTLNGGSGDDSLVGGSGKDSMKGGSGDDTLDGGIGNDKYWGGDGDDLFIYTADGSKDTIFDYEDGDMLQILDGSFSKSKYKKGTLTLTIGKGSLTFKNITTSTEFNINGDDYYISNKKLVK